MNRLLFTLATLLMAFTAMADRVIVFNAQDIWPEPVCMETSFGPMPTGYYLIAKDDVEVEFNINEELENEHDAYYYQGKMNIYSTRYGIKTVTFSYPKMSLEVPFTLLYAHNYQYTFTTTDIDGQDDGNVTTLEFFDTYREYVGLEGKADIWTITVTLDDDGPTQLTEAPTTRSVARVQYFNLAGQEVTQPAGLTIRLTTYSDGTKSVEKCLK
ncbi:MAG: hypothetical protein IJK41_09370 [Muribaculaceae bacterium]|nr:hypothetical protein [Muribaculaceae bacterium]